jgi:hypothetical protein
MPYLIFRRARVVFLGALISGCLLHRPVDPPADACLTNGAPTDYIVRDAANALIASKGQTWDRMRVLAAVPLVVDSIRAHSRVLTDQAVCAKLWLRLDSQDRGAHIAVVQIGQTYWARSTNGMSAFDDKFRQVAAFVDL